MNNNRDLICSRIPLSKVYAVTKVLDSIMFLLCHLYPDKRVVVLSEFIWYTVCGIWDIK